MNIHIEYSIQYVYEYPSLSIGFHHVIIIQQHLLIMHCMLYV